MQQISQWINLHLISCMRRMQGKYFLFGLYIIAIEVTSFILYPLTAPFATPFKICFWQII